MKMHAIEIGVIFVFITVNKKKIHDQNAVKKAKKRPNDFKKFPHNHMSQRLFPYYYFFFFSVFLN